MATQLLMARATAIWLIDNTSLTFNQIAKLCDIHPLEIKAMADGETSQNILGLDPILGGQLSREEITKAEQDPDYIPEIIPMPASLTETNVKKRKRYTPLSKRHDRPNAILWLIRNYPELKDSQIVRLVGTTKSTIEQIRNNTHWNMPNLTPIDPVILGLCSQGDFNKETANIKRFNKNDDQNKGETLMPASYTQNLELEDNQTNYQKNLNKLFMNFKN